MDMMNEFLAYSWQRFREVIPGVSNWSGRGWLSGSGKRREIASEQATILTGGMVWVCWLNWIDPWKIGRSRARLSMPPRLSRGRRYMYIPRTNQARTSGANIWSLATKNSGRANRRVDLFPYNAAFLAFFFRLSPPLPSLPPSAPYPTPALAPSLVLPPRCLHSREYSSIYLKMTPITQVKYTRALICCLSM